METDERETLKAELMADLEPRVARMVQRLFDDFTTARPNPTHLDPTEVAEIRRLLAEGCSLRSIATQYGRSRTTIRNIRDGVTYVDDVIDVVSAPKTEQ